MKNIGIISEYNPFHHGHAHQIEQSLAQTGADSVITIMSGSFVQRGYPAIYDKWLRTELALLSGANLVIECPVHYAVSSADFFARGAIETLMATGIVDYLSFGSEYDNLNQLTEIAKILTKEPPHFKEELKASLSKGHSYPKARATALSQTFGKELINEVSQSNSILALEYLKWLEHHNHPFSPVLIKRKGSAYHDENVHSHYSSATAIRKRLLDASRPVSQLELEQLMPAPNAALIHSRNPYPVSIKDFETQLLYRLKTLSPTELSNIREVNEGIENRVLLLSKTAKTYDDLVNGLKHKRITQTKCQRLLLNVLLNHTTKTYLPPAYIRVLGFDEKGQTLLSQMKEKASLPIITTVSKASSELLDSPLFQLDRRASNLYDMVLPLNEQCKGEPDFIKKPIIIKSQK